MQRALDFDKTPALAVPLPFLLNVPFFALLAGALAAWAGPDAFTSRWAPATLALTHLWTLGILGSAMLGALLQILAVACNVPVGRARLVSSLVHAALTTGTLFLVAGFLVWWPTAWRTAAWLLGCAFATYLTATSLALWRHRQQVYAGAREILVPVRGALAALAVTVGLGLTLAFSLSMQVPPPDWVDSHVLWGLFGWGMLLPIAMSFQLLPIFQLTELHPAALTRWLPRAVILLLPIWTLCQAAPPDWMPAWAIGKITEILLAALYTLWTLVTLQRLWTRKRPKPEPMSLFWYAGMASLLGCTALWFWWIATHTAAAILALGTLFIVGGLGSIVNGMLYKILSFLLWKHAQDAVTARSDDPGRVRQQLKSLPKMAQYIPERTARLQWVLHLAVILSWTLAATGWHPAASAAGPLMLASAIVLTGNVAHALRLYRRTLERLRVS